MEKQNKPVAMTRGNALGGTLLIVLGIAFLVGQIFDFHLGHYLWPFMVIVPGVFLFFGALALDEEAGKALAIFSGIVTMVGIILFVMTFTDLWASWSYAWALVAPTGPGLGLWLLGTLKKRDELVKTGKDLLRVGLIIFVVAAVFFELVIGVSGLGFGRYGLPLLLIALGLFLLIRNLGHGWRNA
ncbi:MAG: hypothetical protein IPM53_29135 [Anaerolineaceae bacterium]|nr:hypothetical protein [Anaerolineaceae bacterium]